MEKEPSSTPKSGTTTSNNNTIFKTATGIFDANLRGSQKKTFSLTSTPTSRITDYERSQEEQLLAFEAHDYVDANATIQKESDMPLEAHSSRRSELKRQISTENSSLSKQFKKGPNLPLPITTLDEVIVIDESDDEVKVSSDTCSLQDQDDIEKYAAENDSTHSEHEEAASSSCSFEGGDEQSGQIEEYEDNDEYEEEDEELIELNNEDDTDYSSEQEEPKEDDEGAYDTESEQEDENKDEEATDDSGSQQDEEEKQDDDDEGADDSGNENEDQNIDAGADDDQSVEFV